MVDGVVADTMLSPRSQLERWSSDFGCKLTAIKFPHTWSEVLLCAWFLAIFDSYVRAKVDGFESPAPVGQADVFGSPGTSKCARGFEAVVPGPGISSNFRNHIFQWPSMFGPLHFKDVPPTLSLC